MKERVCSLLLAVAALAALLTPVSAARSAPVRVGCMDIEGFLITGEEDSVPRGYGAEYLQELSKYTGWDYTFVHGTWSECMERLRNGEIDLLFPVERSAERESYMRFSEAPCCIDHVSLLTLQENMDYYYEDYEHYDGIRVGMIEGNYLNKIFEDCAARKGFTFEPHYYPDHASMDRALADGETDAVVMGNLTETSRLKILARIDSVPAYFAVGKNRPELLSQLNAALDELQADSPFFVYALEESYYNVRRTSAKSFTREEQAYIDSAPVLTMLRDSANAPFEYYSDELHAYTGINEVLMRRLFELCGLRYESVYCDNLTEAWERIGRGEADLITGVYVDGALERKYDLTGTEPYMHVDYYLVGTAGNTVTETSTVAVREASVGLRSFLRLKHPDWEQVTAPSLGECLEIVNNGGAVAGLVNSMTLQSQPLLLRYPGQTLLSSLSDAFPVQLGVRAGADPRLVSVLNKGISMLAQQEVERAVMLNVSAAKPMYSLANIWLYQRPLALSLIAAAVLAAVCIAMLILQFRQKSREAAAMAAKNQELQLANASRDSFFSRMSHDMRTPMNAILGLTLLAEQEAEDPEQVRGYLHKARLSGLLLMQLLDDVLNSAKLDSRTLELRVAPYRLACFQEEMEAIILPSCSEKNITFTFTAKTSLVEWILADQIRLKQLASNLLSNAVKFTPEGGHVWMDVETLWIKDGRIRVLFTVRDDGVGISEEYQSRMFEPFSQYGTDERGQGLGLAIVRGLVELMNGSIRVESAPGAGARFDVELEFDIHDPPEKKQPAERGAFLKGKRVLVCEDHPLNTEIVLRLLETAGAAVECACNGEEGLARFSASPVGYFDAVLMDIRMPVKDGLEATRAIRGLDRPDAAAVPIIAMSANAYREDVERSIQAGMNTHLAKPIDPGLFYETLRRLLIPEEH